MISIKKIYSLLLMLLMTNLCVFWPSIVQESKAEQLNKNKSQPAKTQQPEPPQTIIKDPNDSRRVPPGATCYLVGPDIDSIPPTKEDLQNQLKSLEESYKNKKINYTTYQERKKSILEQINNPK